MNQFISFLPTKVIFKQNAANNLDEYFIDNKSILVITESSITESELYLAAIRQLNVYGYTTDYLCVNSMVNASCEINTITQFALSHDINSIFVIGGRITNLIARSALIRIKEKNSNIRFISLSIKLNANEISDSYIYCEEHSKYDFRHDDKCFPDVAIFDIGLFKNREIDIIKSELFSLLCSIINNYTNKKSDGLKKLYLQKSLDLLCKNMPILAKDFSNNSAMESLVFASLINGYANSFRFIDLSLVCLEDNNFHFAYKEACKMFLDFHQIMINGKFSKNDYIKINKMLGDGTSKRAEDFTELFKQFIKKCQYEIDNTNYVKNELVYNFLFDNFETLRNDDYIFIKKDKLNI